MQHFQAPSHQEMLEAARRLKEHHQMKNTLPYTKQAMPSQPTQMTDYLRKNSG